MGHPGSATEYENRKSLVMYDLVVIVRLLQCNEIESSLYLNSVCFFQLVSISVFRGFKCGYSSYSFLNHVLIS